jgi:hypothetical protein
MTLAESTRQLQTYFGRTPKLGWRGAHVVSTYACSLSSLSLSPLYLEFYPFPPSYFPLVM